MYTNKMVGVTYKSYNYKTWIKEYVYKTKAEKGFHIYVNWVISEIQHGVKGNSIE